ncbi:MAG: InlB B-repeat-containing protein [Bacteroidales bacterium]|nr:InlB B-repeat-containing protein [Bacteroidales bacterium]
MYITSITITYENAPSTYTVFFDCDGGTANCPDDIEDLDEGDDFTIPSTAPTKDCYTFGGWFDDELIEYELGETYPCPASDLTLTADWTLNKYSVTYKPNGATGENSVVSNLNCGSSYTITGKPNAWTAPGATPNFVNWNTQADGQGTTYAVDQVITISDNLELYAQWSATASYTVTYDCNGGESGCPDNATVLDGTQITLPAAPTYAGHTFDGWMCDADLQTYAAGASYTVTGHVEFEAQWLENLSNPTFNVTGVSNGTANTYYVTATITINQEEGASIYYTTDGSDPSDASTEYGAPFAVTNSCTIKAIAIFDGYGDSQIVSQEIIIVQPNVAAFTDGVYSESFNSSLGLWYAYNVTGDKVWAQGSVTASQVTYTGANINGYQENNEDWLISPKMTAENGKVVVSFSTVARYYSSNYTLVVKYSTNYNGYGAPSGATWKTLSPTIATAPNSGFSSWTSSGNVVISELSTSTDPLTNSTPIYLAFVYTSATGSGNATQYFIKDFTAKQCYPITYYANYENPTGSTVDANSPYAVGTEVTILANAFTAPSGKEFTSWNTQADGEGITKNPGEKVTMTTAGYELYAQWGEACVLAATMNATTGAAVYNYNSGNKRFDINLSSSVDVLGGCDIFDYGFVYSTTVATPEVGADNCTKVQVGDSQPAVDDLFEATIENATLDATYHVRSYATNAAGTAYSEVINVEVPANFDEYRYEISYTTNGTQEASTYVYQGAPISGLATPTPANIPAGYTFMGWYGDDYALNNAAPSFIKNGDAINSDLDLKAVFATQTGTSGALTTSEITTNFTNAAMAYNNDPKSYTDTDDGITWTVKGYAPNRAPWIQLRKNSTVAYLKITASNNISNIRFTITNTTTETGQSTSEISNHSAFSGCIVLLSSATANATEQTSGNLGYTNSVSNNIANVSPTSSVSEVYVQVTAAARIWNVEVTCASYSNYCTSVTDITENEYINNEGKLTNDITISSGALSIESPVTIPSGKTLTVEGTGVLVNTDPANLIIEDGGQLITSNAVAATVKKNVEKANNWGAGEYTPDGWYFIALPLNSDEVTPSMLTTGDYDLYHLNPGTATWENYKTHDGNDNPGFTLANGEAYLYANNAGLTVDFAGTVKASAASQNVGVSAGWNLVGNPFTYNTYLNRPYYKLNDDRNDIEIVNNNAAIAPCTGVLVKITTEENVTFTKTDQSVGANNGNINIALAQTHTTRGVESMATLDKAILSFNEGSELPKFYFGTQNANIYIPLDNEEYAIVSSNAQGEMPVNFRAYVAGEYTITVNPEEVEMGYLHLIDNISGNDIDLLATPSYTFSAKADDYESRFRLVFSTTMVNAEMGEDFAFISNGQLVIANEGEATLQVIDVTGRVVANENINGTCSKAINAKAGVYVLRLINGTDVKTQKIVIR